MWLEAKIQIQKEYFAAQRKQPTGNFPFNHILII